MSKTLLERKARSYGYVPYTGGAGPTMHGAWANGDALCKALKAIGHDTACVKDVVDTVSGNAERVVALNGRYVVYDRWGFCDINGGDVAKLDQADINAAAAYLIG